MKKYEFVDLGIDSTKFPFNSHLWWYNATYGFLMVDGSDQTVLLHSTKAKLLVDPSDWDIVNLSDNTNSYKIQSGYLDGNDLWLISCNNPGNDFEVFFIELDDTNDCNPIGVSTRGNNGTVYAYDIVKMGDGNFYSTSRDIQSISTPYTEVDLVTTAPFTHKSHYNNSADDLSFAVVITSTTFIYLEHVSISINAYEYDTVGGTISLISPTTPRPNNHTLPPRSQAAIAYDGSNILYFVAQKNADSKYYLWTYNISDDEFTEKDEYNIALMLDRNNVGTSPTELEKAFGISNEIVYEIKPVRGGLAQFQNMSVLLTTNIIAISDNYLMVADTGGGVYPLFELQDVSESEISSCDMDYLMGNVTTCEFISTDDLQNLTSVKFYDDSDILTFFGNIIEKQYNDLNSFYYKAVSYDNEINTYKFSKDETAGDTDAKVIIEEVLDSANWLHYGSSSITSPTINIKASFKNISFKDFMDEIADRCDYIWYVTPDGTVYFNDGTTASGKTVLHNSGILTNPKIKVISAQINHVKLYGGYINGVRITSIDEDTTAQQLYGPIEYIDHFPHITDQTELDTLAGKIRARNGMNNSPFYVDVGLFGQEFIQCGNTVNFAFSPLSYAADDLIVLNYTYEAKNDEGMYKLSTGIVQNVWRGYGTVDKKTKSSDEEQIDILGAEVSGLIAGGMIDLEDDTTPQLGGALDTAGNSINDDTGDNIVDIDDDLNIQGSITLTGTVDGIDVAARDHAKYTAAEADARIVVQNTHPAGTIDVAVDALIATHKGIAGDHHTATVAGDLNLNDLAEKDHASLTNVTAGQHHNAPSDLIYSSLWDAITNVSPPPDALL